MNAAEIFARALEVPTHERLELVRRVARGDARVLAEVQSLLAYHESMGEFMAAESPPEHVDPVEPAVDAVAGHRLVRKLGEGGYGTVHLARELGALPRNVAIKFLKSALVSPGALSRFAAERQILAKLTHDGIARIYTAGTTALGCPYYTMEWVDGPPIDRHCDDERMLIADRIILFLQVCRAIAYAHQRGVIHGDLKPHNVLVCTVDGGASPKVIDFGVARSLGEPSAGAAPVGTPRYMSPEQRLGAPADTRCDVFALGVLLHDLLAGSATADPADASPIATLRARGDEVERLARLRGVSRLRLRRTLTGDLDHVVMAATRADPEGRYTTVRELIADLEAWKSSRPLPSRPRTMSYVVSKFLRRNGLLDFVC